MKKLIIILLLVLFILIDIMFISVQVVLRFPKIYWQNLLYNLKVDITLLPQSFREVLNMWDSNGLKHNATFLNNSRNAAIFWPIKKQARYADIVTVRIVKQENHLLVVNSMQPGDPIEWDFLNTTSIGNVAYVALHAKEKELRDIAKEKLDQIKNEFQALV